MKLTKEDFFNFLKKNIPLQHLARQYGLRHVPGNWKRWKYEFLNSSKTIDQTSDILGFFDEKTTSEEECASSVEKPEHDKKVYFSACYKDEENGNLKIMPIEEYCFHYNLPYEDVSSYKLIKHNGGAYYNIFFREKNKKIDDDSLDGIKQIEIALQKWANGKGKVNRNFQEKKKHGDAVIVISDLHLGSLVTGLIKTPNFSKEICIEYLESAVDEINKQVYDNAHVFILGDLVETISGLNHINSWQELGHKEHGANIIKIATEVLHEHFLSKIQRLKNIKIVAGNHDRLTAQKDADPECSGANLIAWGLSLLGYNIEYNSLCIRNEVDDICYVLLHGDKGISRKQTKEIVWDYGKQGIFNVVLEGHLHSRMERTVNRKLPQLKHLEHCDTVDTRRFICPSFFTGNFYSESNGWTSTPGFKIIKSNGKGRPNVFDYTL
jgi:predicted phosphodiesterase